MPFTLTDEATYRKKEGGHSEAPPSSQAVATTTALAIAEDPSWKVATKVTTYLSPTTAGMNAFGIEPLYMSAKVDRVEAVATDPVLQVVWVPFKKHPGGRVVGFRTVLPSRSR